MKWISLWLTVLVLVLGMAACTEKGGETAVDSSFEEVISSSQPGSFESLPSESSTESDDKVEIILPANIVPGWENLYPVMYKMGFISLDHKSGYVTLEGDFAFELESVTAMPFKEGLACIMVDEGEEGYVYYYINAKGEKQFGTGFMSNNAFNGGRAAVYCKDDRWRVIDIENNAVYLLDKEIHEAYNEYSEGMLGVRSGKGIDDRYGYCDEYGNLVVPMTWRAGGQYSEGLAAVVKQDKEDNSTKYIDKKGNIVLDVGVNNYDPISGLGNHAFLEGVAYVDGYYVDKNGKKAVVVPQKILNQDGFIEGKPFSEGLAAITIYEKTESKTYFINKAGKIVIDSLPYIAGNFYNGVAYITSDALQFGFINTKGQILVKSDEYNNIGSTNPYIDLTYDFENGLCRVWHMGEETWQGYIDTKGNIICKIEMEVTE